MDRPIDSDPKTSLKIQNQFKSNIRICMYYSIAGMLLIIILLSGCSRRGDNTERTGSKTMDSFTSQIQKTLFGRMEDGREAYLYTFSNSGGMEVDITNYGGIITSIRVPDRNGNRENVLLGFDTLEQYLGSHPFFGAIVGRYANRIADGAFSINGKQYQLSRNDGVNHLHGGSKGFYTRLWNPEVINGNTLQLTYFSQDGEEGYPGNLEVTVTYTLTDLNELIISYKATTDRSTPVNLTSHAYFNLSGDHTTDILTHQLMLHADYYTPVNTQLIPTGELISVRGTPFDFTTSQPIGARIDKVPGGYDHNFVLRPSSDSLRLAGILYHPESGRKMEVLTSKPGIQFYSGNFLDGSLKGFNGIAYEKYAGLCLETQYYPDSPNQPAFPSTILNPGDIYRSTTIYKFSAE
jgi:aldose 1-epimerase